jgi:serine/threonine protein kinase
LKPANLIVRPDGRIALVDFGSARASEKGATHGATVTGTFGYAPLEQLGGSADERSDLYGLGATLIHAITGIPPGELLTPGFAIDFREHAQVSAQLRDFLAALVAPRASERPASAALAAGLLRSQAPPHRPRRAFADLSVNAAPMPADGVFKLIWIVSELDWPKLAWIGCKVAAVAFLELCAISAGALAYELSSGRLTAYNLFHLLD